MVRGTDSSRKHGTEQQEPRAIIHKQILDHAEANPNESMEAIADAVSGATTTTVERVLEEYGDPAADSATEPPPAASGSTAKSKTTGAETATSDAKPNGTETTNDAESDDTEPSTDDTAPSSNEADADERTPEPDVTVTDGGAASETATAAMTSDSTTEGPEPTERDAPRDGEPEHSIDRSALTEKQRETLRAIYDHPDATQAELADRLGVSSPTISQRVNSIDGFDWSDRNALVAPLFDPDDSETEDCTPFADDTDDGPGSSERDGDAETSGDATDESQDEPNDRTRQRADSSTARLERAPAETTDRASENAKLTELVDRVDELADQLVAVERELETLERGTAGREGGTESSVLSDPELAHKIVHACLQSDRVSEEEELRLLRDVTASGAAAGTNGNPTRSG